MRDRREQLIWTELDGELSEAEVRELAELRAPGKGSAEADELEAEIRSLAARLDEVESVAAPAELRGSILEAVTRRGVQGGEQSGGQASIPSLGHFPARIRAAPAWTKWAAVAAGLSLAVVAHQIVFGPGPEDTAGLSGTVLPAPSPEDGSIALPSPTELATSMDFVRLTSQGSRLTASFTPGEGAFTFAFRAPGLEVEHLEFQDGATGSHDLDTDQLTLRVRGPGRAELVLVLGHAEQPFTFSGFGDGIQPFERELSLVAGHAANFQGADR